MIAGRHNYSRLGLFFFIRIMSFLNRLLGPARSPFTVLGAHTAIFFRHRADCPQVQSVRRPSALAVPFTTTAALPESASASKSSQVCGLLSVARTIGLDASHFRPICDTWQHYCAAAWHAVPPWSARTSFLPPLVSVAC